MIKMTQKLKVVTIDENNTVVGVCEGDFESPPSDPNILSIDLSTEVRPGDAYNGDGTFTRVPYQRTRLTVLEFRGQFTVAEKQAMYTAANTDMMVKMILDDLAAASYVDTTNQQTIDSVNYLVSVSIITAPRATEVLAGITE